MTHEELMVHMREIGALVTPDIKRAFYAIDRIEFVPADLIDESHEDRPLPIGEGQTISQPSTVARCLELLQPEPGDHILDVGSGSGWTTALLAEIVGTQGEVIGVERSLPLIPFGKHNIEKFNLPQARIIAASKTLGAPESAPFHRILVSASAQEVPHALVDQLAIGGRMVIPIHDSLCVIDRTMDGYTQECHQGYAFVSLVE